MTLNNEPTFQKLKLRFPELSPVTSAPTSISFYGCGFRLFGKFSEDESTGTYVKLHVITFLFVPIFVLGAYRVGNVSYGQSVVLGKQKIGVKAMWMNTISPLCIALLTVAIYLNIYWNSDEYKAKTDLVKAAELVEKGDYLRGMELYSNVARMSVKEQKKLARNKYVEVVKNVLNTGSDEDKSLVSEHLVNVNIFNQIQGEFPKLYENTVERAKRAAEKSPDAALILLNVAESQAGIDTEWVNIKLQLLESIAEVQKPIAIEVVDSLSGIYEQLGEFEKMVNFLEPVKSSIVGIEAARRLGSAYVGMEKYEEAIELLSGYALPMRKRWQNISQRANSSYQNTHQRIVAKIQGGRAPQHLYQKTKDMSEDDAGVVWQDYIEKEIVNDSAYKAVLVQLERTANVPTALMDLGIAHLKYARTGVKNAKEHLQKAEETLLSIGGYAGDSPEYNLFLGQVYYWLGKNEAGKKLFSKLAKTYEKNSALLLNLAHSLREIGIFNDAEHMAKQAYEVGETSEHKNGAAMLMAVLVGEPEKEIEWLEKCDVKSPNIVVRLNSAKADLALSEGDRKKAMELKRKAARGYESMAESSTTLNNHALIYFELFALSSDPGDYEKGLSKMTSALKLNSNNAILNGNAASFFINAAVIDVFKGKLEPSMLAANANLQIIAYLSDTEKEYKSYFDRVADHAHYKKGVQLLEEAITLAPQSSLLYSSAVALYDLEEDSNKLESIVNKFEAADINQSSNEKIWLEELDKQNVADLTESIALSEKSMADKLAILSSEFGKTMARGSHMELQAACWPYVKLEGLDGLIGEAYRNYKKFPNFASYKTYKALLTVKVGKEVEAISPGFVENYIKCKNSINLFDFIFLYIFNDKIYAKSEVKSLNWSVLLKEEESRIMASPTGVWYNDVVVLRQVSSKNVPIALKQIENDKVTQLKQGFYRKYAPYTPTAKLYPYWKLLAEGKLEEASVFYTKLSSEELLIPSF